MTASQSTWSDGTARRWSDAAQRWVTIPQPVRVDRNGRIVRSQPEPELLYHVTYTLRRGPLGPVTVHRNIRARNAARAWDLALQRDGINEVTDLAPYAEGHVRKAHQ